MPNFELMKGLLIDKKEVQKTVLNSNDTEIFEWCLKEYSKNASFTNGNRNAFLTALTNFCNEYGVTESTCMNESKRFIESDFELKEIESTIKSIYRNKKSVHNSKTYDFNFKKSKDVEINKTEIQNELEKTIYLSRKINENTNYIAPIPVLSILKNTFDVQKNVKLFTEGSISVLTGKAKSKKTFLQTLFVSTFFGCFDEVFTPNLPKKNIFYLDTEQSQFECYQIQNRLHRLTSQSLDNFHLFNLRGIDHKNLVSFLNYIVDNYGSTTSLIIIDQLADFCRTVNNEEEAIQIVKLLEKISYEKKIHISCVVHQNKSTDFATGWLGSQLMKKAETVIKVTKYQDDKSISIVEPDLMRGEEFEPFAFKINESGLPELTDISVLNLTKENDNKKRNF